MSWQVKDEITELNNVQNALDKIRDQLFITSSISNLPQSVIGGGASGTGTPQAGGFSGLSAFPVDENVTITDIDTLGIPTLVFDRIKITNSNMVIKAGLLGLANDIKWIDGALNNGQFIILKSEFGFTKTLKTGGNIAITSDITLSGSDFCILIFYEDVTTPDAQGNWIVHKAIGGGGGLVSPLTTKGDIWGYDTNDSRVPVGPDGAVLVADSGQALGIKWDFIAGSQTPWIQPIDGGGFDLDNMPDLFLDASRTLGISGNSFGVTIFDLDPLNDIQTIVGTGVGGFPQFVVTNVSVEMNAPLDMNIVPIEFDGSPIPSPPSGSKKRKLFADSGNSDHLSIRTPVSVIDIEAIAGGGANTALSNLIATAINQDLKLDPNKTIDWNATQSAFTAIGGFATLPGNPLGFILVKIASGNIKIPYYGV